MTLGQFNPENSMFKLSTDRLAGRLSKDEVTDYIIKMREDLINSIETEIYLESSGHLFGALDKIDEIYPDSNFLFIIRDPRNWVKSAMNTFQYILYGPLQIYQQVIIKKGGRR